MKKTKVNSREVKHAAKLVERAQKLSLAQRRERVHLEHEYLTELCNSNFWIARCNTLSRQVENYDTLLPIGRVELIDGQPKSKEYIEGEYYFFKLRALNARRKAYFARHQLKKAGLSDEELSKLVDDLVGLPVVQDSYPQDYNKYAGAADFES